MLTRVQAGSAQVMRADEMAKILVNEPDTSKVNSPHPAYLRMRRDWDPIDDLLDGDDRIRQVAYAQRESQDSYMPRYHAEEHDDYLRRLYSTVLTPGFENAVDDNVARPFAREVQLRLPEADDGETVALASPLDEIERNVDGRGNDLTSFARDVLFDGAARGIAYIYPESVTVGEGARSDTGLRSRLVRIPPRNLFNWHEGVDGNGRSVLTAVWFVEIWTVRVGDFGVREVPYIRELRAPVAATEDAPAQTGIVKLYELDAESGDYKLHRETTHDFDGLPLIVLQYGKKKGDEGLIECRPPLRKIAAMNFAHLRSASRQAQYIDTARIATMFLSGVNKDEMNLTVGPQRIKVVKNEKARMNAVEITGASAKVGWDDLDRWEEKMERAGQEPQRTKSGHPTATGIAINTAKHVSTLESWVRLTERGVEMGYEMLAKWEQRTLPPGWGVKYGVEIWSEFQIGVAKSQDQQVVNDMAEQRIISRATARREARRRGLVSDMVTDAEEERLIAEEDANDRRAFAGDPRTSEFRDENEPGGDPSGGE